MEKLQYLVNTTAEHFSTTAQVKVTVTMGNGCLMRKGYYFVGHVVVV